MAHGSRYVERGAPGEECSGLLGKRVIVDVTYADGCGSGVGRRQFFGVVARVSQRNVSVQLACGSTLDLPPDPGLFVPAPAGPHHLPSTGETVEGADLVIAFTAAGPYGGGALSLVSKR